MDETCPVCGELLAESMTTDDSAFKSCPECSREAGRHVYRPSPAEFGMRNNGGRIMIQSWCQHCRAKTPPPPPAFLCGD